MVTKATTRHNIIEKDVYAALAADLERGGVETGHHESDLHVLNGPAALFILDARGLAKCAIPFLGDDGRAWLSIPHAYAPFWHGKTDLAPPRTSMAPGRDALAAWAALRAEASLGEVVGLALQELLESTRDPHLAGRLDAAIPLLEQAQALLAG